MMLIGIVFLSYEVKIEIEPLGNKHLFRENEGLKCRKECCFIRYGGLSVMLWAYGIINSLLYQDISNKNMMGPVLSLKTAHP